MTFFSGQDGSHTHTLRYNRGLSAACAQQSNETFPAISATKLTASLTGGLLGGLVRMLSYNCTTCWQRGGGGIKRKGKKGYILASCGLVCQFFPREARRRDVADGYFSWKEVAFDTFRFLLFLFVIAHIKLRSSHGTND